MQVFVYGTLKAGHRLHEVMLPAKFIGEDSVRGKLYSLGAFPGIKEGSDSVKGEVYEVDDKLLQLLDRIEGHPHMYERRQVKLESGKNASMYYYKGRVNENEYLPRGVWEKRMY